MESSSRSKLLVYSLAALFFCTGFSALTFQIGWNRILSQTIGTDHQSVTAIVSIFMLGLGLGGYVGSLLLRTRINPVIAFVIVESFVAVFGLISEGLLRELNRSIVVQMTGSSFNNTLAALFLGNFSVLLIPTVLMGMSLPLVAHSVRNILPPGVAIGFLYSFNIFGAASGAFASGVYLVATLGIKLTLAFASALVLVASAIFIAVIKGGKSTESLAVDREGSVGAWAETRIVYLASFAIGFIALGIEVAFFRMFVSYFSATSYVFPIVLTTYLLTMASGNFVCSRLIARRDALTIVRWASVGTSLSVFVIILVPVVLPFFGIENNTFLIMSQTDGWGRLMKIFGFALFLFSPIFFTSWFFPALVQIITRRSGDLGINVGRLYLIQTLGNFLGSLATGVLLAPILGTPNLIKVMAIGILICGALLDWKFSPFVRSRFLTWWPASAGVLVLLLAALVTPARVFGFFQYNGSPPTRHLEELDGTALIYDGPERARIQIGAEPATSFDFQDSRIDIWPVPIWMSMLPQTPKNILLIGIGNAYHGIALRQIFPEANITIVELLDVVIREMKERGAPKTRHLLETSKILIMDGRRFVNQIKSHSEKYDLIQSGVFHVTSSGAGSLFTKEMVENYRGLLTENGILTFNAYMPAVKAGLQIFKKVVVVSRGPELVADVVFANNDSFDFSKLSSELQGSFTHAFAVPQGEHSFSSRFPPEAFFIHSRSDLEAAVQDVDIQTDDSVATEYFLTKRTTWEGLKDPRAWKPTPNAILIKSLLKEKI